MFIRISLMINAFLF